MTGPQGVTSHSFLHYVVVVGALRACSIGFSWAPLFIISPRNILEHFRSFLEVKWHYSLPFWKLKWRSLFLTGFAGLGLKGAYPSKCMEGHAPLTFCIQKSHLWSPRLSRLPCTKVGEQQGIQATPHPNHTATTIWFVGGSIWFNSVPFKCPWGAGEESQAFPLGYTQVQTTREKESWEVGWKRKRKKLQIKS